MLLLSTLLGVGIAGVARAQEEAKPGWSYGLASELMSPYCPGRSLPDCPSPQAAELRQWILVQEREGRSEDEVMRQLVARFGEGLLQKPRARGFGLAAYAMPIAGFLAGAALLYVFFRRQFARSTPEPVAPLLQSPVDPELERLVDEEFRRAKDGA
jgi:cytochrome c-type biogenesis protein CcmH/NrfF